MQERRTHTHHLWIIYEVCNFLFIGFRVVASYGSAIYCAFGSSLVSKLPAPKSDRVYCHGAISFCFTTNPWRGIPHVTRIPNASFFARAPSCRHPMALNTGRRSCGEYRNKFLGIMFRPHHTLPIYLLRFHLSIFLFSFSLRISIPATHYSLHNGSP